MQHPRLYCKKPNGIDWSHFTFTNHRKYGHSTSSRMMNKNQLSDCQGDKEPFKDARSTDKPQKQATAIGKFQL